MLLVTTWFGTFLLEDGDVVASEAFPDDPDGVADRLQAVREGRVLDEERELAPDEPFRVADERLADLEGATVREGAPPEVETDVVGADPDVLAEASRKLATRRVRDSLGGDDRHVVHAVGAVDDLHETTNLLAERIREWFGLHFPELPDQVEDAEELVQLVARHGTREAIVDARPDLDRDRGVGAKLDPATRDRIQAVARVASAAVEAREALEDHLGETAPEVASNLTELVGAPIAARLLRLAGGLEDLAKLPSGTVQTLGAEKALFRHLTEDAPPPKHGVLYQHPLVHRAPPDQRGKVARALAGKACIAARADAFTGADVAGDLQAELDARVEEIEGGGGT
jgi:nucleolar protein 56